MTSNHNSHSDIGASLHANQDEELRIPNAQNSCRIRQLALPDYSPSMTSHISHNDDRSTCSATIDTMVTGRTMTSTNRRELDDLFDNLLENKSVDKTDCDGESTESNDGESTTMSSVLPDDAACHMYTPPMEIIPEACSEHGSCLSRNDCDQDRRIDERRVRTSSPDKENFSGNYGNNSALYPRDCDDRPEEVYVETFSNQSFDGARSETSSSSSRRYRSSGSITRRPGINADVSLSGSAVTTNNGVSNILQSMGLGPWEDDGGKGLNKNKVPNLDTLLGGDELGGNNNTNLKKTSRERKKRMIHLRAGMIMIFLVSLSFFAAQLSAIAQHDLYLRRGVQNQGDANEDTLRSHYQKDKSGLLRGLPKIPRTLNEFANPVHASNGDGMAKADMKRKAMVVDAPTADLAKSDLMEKGATNPIPIAYMETADVAKIDLIEKDVTNPAASMHTDGAVNGSVMEMRAPLINEVVQSVEQHQSDIAKLTPNVIESALEGIQDTSKNVVHGPVDNLSKIDTHNQVGLPFVKMDSISNQSTDGVTNGIVEGLRLDGYENLSNIQAPDFEHKDVPFFWNVPLSGGEMIKEVLKSCMLTVIASEAGSMSEHTSDMFLSTFDIRGRKFVNVDVSSKEGIQRAKGQALVQSGMAEVIISPLFHDVLTLFDGNHHGRAFTVLRHPIERAISTYHDRKRANDRTVSKMTLAQYGLSPQIENNWMVRYLTGTIQGEVNAQDLAVAKEVLRTKFIVGLHDRQKESMERVKNYFSFQSDPSLPQGCAEDILQQVSIYASDYTVRDGTPTWTLLEWQNRFDIELYIYGQELFDLQGEQIFNAIQATQSY